MARLMSLPNEIFNKITKLLDDDLLNLRLTCRQMNKLALHHVGEKFFSKKVVHIFIPRSLEILEHISKHTTFRNYLKAINLSGAFIGFDSDELTLEAVKAKQDRQTFPRVDPQHFLKVLRDQRWLKSTGISTVRLVDVLRRLPKLESLGSTLPDEAESRQLHNLVHSFIDHRDVVGLSDCHKACPYREYGNEEGGDTDFFEYSDYSDSGSERSCICWNDPVFELDAASPTDMLTLILSLFAQTKANIRTLSLAPPGPPLTSTSFVIPRAYRKAIKSRLSRLDELVVDNIAVSDSNNSYSILQFLDHCSAKLSNLSLKFRDIEEEPYFLRDLLDFANHPKLQTLTLGFSGKGELFVGVSPLKKFLRRHAATLRDLSLLDAQTNGSFVECLEVMQNEMQLKSLELTNIDDHSYKSPDRYCCHTGGCALLKKVCFKGTFKEVKDGLGGLITVLKLSCRD